MWKTLHGAQHSLMEFSWENLRGFWFGRRTVLAMNQSSGVTARDRRRKGYMCISSFFVSIFRGSPGTKQQLLQTSPSQSSSPAPFQSSCSSPGECGYKPSTYLPLPVSEKRQAQDTSAKDILNPSSMPKTDTKHWDTDVALGAWKIIYPRFSSCVTTSSYLSLLDWKVPP